MKSLKIADLFCGAGGTSTGAIEAGEQCGYEVHVTAVNHWQVAIATHEANHPKARHLCTGIDDINPRTLFADSELDVLWASPECTHHSVARGGKPINDQSRATAWCVTRWAEAIRPGAILVENVPEFLTWGPIDAAGKRPLKSKKGETFRAWVGTLRSLGYKVDWRILCAADYGDPTTRRRLFVQAVRGRRRIVWPDATHAPTSETDLFGSRKAWATAREQVIDWNIPAPSIYERTRPLSPKTMARIMKGLRKFGLNPSLICMEHGGSADSTDLPVRTITTARGGAMGVAKPFIMSAGGPECPARSVDEPCGTVLTRDHRALVTPFIVPQFGEREGQAPRVHSVDQPISTVSTSGAHHALATPFLVQVNHAGGNRTRSVDAPLPTVCGNRGEWAVCAGLLPQQSDGVLRSVDEPTPTVATAGAIALVEPYLVEYYGNGGPQSTDTPLNTVTTKDRHALVRPRILVNGQEYILDIGFRMLQPHELAAAQGFRRDYQFTGNKTEQVKQIGNAVPRRLARALVAAVLTQKPDVSWLQDSEVQA